jgi:hypothetical protein
VSEHDGTPLRPLFDRSEDHAYFQAIEALFIELRGAPFQLSPDDFKITKAWRGEGVPLDVALTTLREKVSQASDEGDDPKRRLSYYRRAVERAWQRQRELAAPGAAATAEALDVAPRLSRLASRVPPSLPQIRQRIDQLLTELMIELMTEHLSAEEVDLALGEIDQAMLDAAREALTDSASTELAERVAQSLAALAGRLGGTSESARSRVEPRLLRDLAGLPLLSLFSPDALEDPGLEDPVLEESSFKESS